MTANYLKTGVERNLEVPREFNILQTVDNVQRILV